MTSYVYLFIFFVILFHSSIFVYLKSDHVWTTSEKGKQWIKLGAGRDSKTAHKTSENSKKKLWESRNKIDIFSATLTETVAVFKTSFHRSKLHKTARSCMYLWLWLCVCVCWKAESLLLLFFSLFCLFFLHVGTSTVKSIKGKRALKRQKLENTSTGNWF